MNPRALAQMEPGLMASWSTACSTQWPAARGDLIAEFAGAIPIEVIGNLLDIPRASAGRCATGRWPFSARWSRALGRGDGSTAATAR